MAVEGDLPEDKRGESNILAISEEHVSRSLSKMKEGLYAPFANEERETIENLEASQIQKMVTHEEAFPITDTGFKDEDDEDNLPLRWKIKIRMMPTSSKGKEKVAGETEPRGRHITPEGQQTN